MWYFTLTGVSLHKYQPFGDKKYLKLGNCFVSALLDPVSNLFVAAFKREIEANWIATWF